MTARLLSLTAVAALALMAGACSTPKGPGATAATATEQWADKVQVVARPDSIRLGVHADGPSPNQASALSDFVANWMQADGGVIEVQAPVGASPRMIAGVYQLLTAQGAPADVVKLSSYDAGGETTAPIVVGFERYEAIAPRCGLDWESLTKTSDNEAYNNFGCAVTANIAAQVANPQDLLRPRDTTPVDAQRRTTVLDKYRRGEITSSARDEQAAGTVAKAVN